MKDTSILFESYLKTENLFFKSFLFVVTFPKLLTRERKSVGSLSYIFF